MLETRFKIIPEVHLILRSGKKMLLLHRYQTGYMDGFYSLVAGHVDGNETFKAAMAREALEEAGITIETDDLHLVHTMHRVDGDERLSLFFEVKRWTGSITNMEPHKCDDLAWYIFSEKAEHIIPYVAAAIHNISIGQPYSEFGWR